MPDDPLHHITLELDGLSLAITSRDHIGGLADLSQRTGHLFISIKNRAFNRRLIDGFCRVVSAHMRNGHITVVDAPYLHNVEAVTSDPEERARKAESIRLLSRDRTRQVERIMRNHPDAPISFLAWSELVEATPAWITAEIEAAYARNGAFRRLIAEHCRKVLPAFDAAADPLAFERFLIEELPPIFHAYYLLDGGVADFYPGPNGYFFWDIEFGRLADELPRLTQLAQSHRGLVYVEFRAEDGS